MKSASMVLDMDSSCDFSQYHLPLHTAGVKTVLPFQYACHPASFYRRREMIIEPGAAFVPNFPRRITSGCIAGQC